MIMTSTSTLQDRAIVEYLGLVSGEAILGANVFRGAFAGVRDIVGGGSGTYERSLREAREVALREIEEAARHLGGDAVIGVDLAYESIVVGSGESILMVSAVGTAVRLGPG